jgi:hypothetical protein
LKRTLQSLACAKYRVLTKNPKGKEVNTTDQFFWNAGFTDEKRRIKINQIQLKETKEENKTTHERVAADRHYETQAAIVRIMKGTKEPITHPQLIADVIKATQHRGALQPADIKTNIEKYVYLFPRLASFPNPISPQAHREGLHGTGRGQQIQLCGIDLVKLAIHIYRLIPEAYVWNCCRTRKSAAITATGQSQFNHDVHSSISCV